MTLSDFYVMCKKRDWKELINFLTSDVKDLSTKILVSAILGELHPDKNIAAKYGLKIWDGVLSQDNVPPMLSLLTSAVDLADFTSAYYLAMEMKADFSQKMQDLIVDYVKRNKMQLGPFLRSDKLRKEERQLILDTFGDLTLTKSQLENYYKMQFTTDARKKIAYLQAADRVATELGMIFDLKPHEFHVYFSKPSSMRGIKSDDGDKGGISFNDSLSNETMKQYEKTLSDLGISASYYNMTLVYGKRGGRGITLYTSPLTIDKKLTQFQKDLAANLETTSTPLKDQGFFKAKADLEIYKNIKATQSAAMKLNN